ncbi:LD-carboxypeptidase [Sphingomonas lacunae]|uniref:LD-carboxypeptidase n=1 Tax=Sphingomonas lacunae TaxID=2698828 RepID=A0A6M4AWT9_9SPHN|nr:LD-carboxypeptidase [Sphingomonas lacunae]QJQ33226.1 LD-carboxypeptidase [Sphingomonas lacunae]
MVTRIGIVAPSVYIFPRHYERVNALVAAQFPDVELVWHPQVFARSPDEVSGNTGFVLSDLTHVPEPAHHGHFAGSDAQRTAAFVEMANREDIDAIWFARGGYGAGRIALDVLPQLGPAARRKTYMGYSDASYMLALLYRAGFPHLCHGPMVIDSSEGQLSRALAWMARKDPRSLEPGLKRGEKYVAFNLISAAMMVGTPLFPDISGHVLMVEEVGEYLYAVDRCFFALTSAVWRDKPAEIRLGQVTDIKENDRPFGKDEVGIARDWCQRSNIRYGGRCEIGHYPDNKIVPFGLFGG